MNSPNYECVPCDNIRQAPKFLSYLFAYIALIYVPIFVLFLAIIFLNFKLTSSAAMGFVFYAQMIGSEAFCLTASALVTNRGYQNVETAYKIIYGIFNLNSLSFWMKPFCLNEHFNTLVQDVMCLDYAIAGFPLIMIALMLKLPTKLSMAFNLNSLHVFLDEALLSERAFQHIGPGCS